MVMEKVLQIFDWKRYFREQEGEVIGGAFHWYTRHFARILFYLGLVYALAFQTTSSITCEQSNARINPHYVNKMCVMPYYGAHTLHRSPYSFEQVAANYQREEMDHSQDEYLIKFDYYIWVYVIVIALSFSTYLPWLIFESRERDMLDQLRKIVKFVNYLPLDSDASKYCVPNEETHNFVLKSQQMPPKSQSLETIDNPPKVSEEETYESSKSSIRVACAVQLIFLDPGCRTYCLNFLCVQLYTIFSLISHMICLNYIFHGLYWKYGWEWARYWLGAARDQPKERLFPYLATCHFKMYGHTGHPKQIDSLCIMHYNLLNQYIFTFIWFALVCFAALLTLHLIVKLVRVAVLWLFSSKLRRRTEEIINTFKHMSDWHNINRAYNQEILLDKIYFWPLIMLELTSIDVDLLMEKLQDIYALLRETGEIHILDKLEQECGDQFLVKT